MNENHKREEPSYLSPLDPLSAARLAQELHRLSEGNRDSDRGNIFRNPWFERLLMWAVSIAVAWSAMQVRVAVLETDMSNTKTSLQRIEQGMNTMQEDIKTLIRQSNTKEKP